MNYYRRYVGDYLRDTPRLSVLEHGAYNLLLDYYYADEQPLPKDRLEVYTMVRAMTPVDRKAVDKVLDKYFELQDDGWHNKRADHEIEVSQKARDNGKKGGPKGGGGDTGLGTGNENPVNKTPPKTGTGQATGLATGSGGGSVHPPTTNHQPPPASLQPPASTHQPGSRAKARAKKPAPPVSLPPWTNGRPEILEAWQAFVEMRKAKRKPLTERAVELTWKDLSNWNMDGHDVVPILLRSVQHGWTGVHLPDAERVSRATSGAASANERAAQTWLAHENTPPAIATLKPDALPDDFIVDFLNDWGHKLGVTQGADESEAEFYAAVVQAVEVEANTGNADATEWLERYGEQVRAMVPA